MMNSPLVLKAYLALGGAIAIGVGATILAAPDAFYALNDIALGADPSLRSEVRAPAGALLAVGLLMLAGALTPALAQTALLAGSLVYLSYGLARVLSLAVDGWPGASLVEAAALELVIGSIGAFLTHRYRSGFGRPAASA